MLHNLLLVVHVLIAIGLIGLVLIQQGKGADAGAAFGSGASGTMFGSRGAASFLTRSTGILATLFFVTSLSLAYLANNQAKPTSVLDGQAPAKQEQVIEQGPVDVPMAPESAPVKGNKGATAPASESDVPAAE